eukprot:scaffold3136_cov102-Cylindrotheca_fusiformis.AAC.8
MFSRMYIAEPGHIHPNHLLLGERERSMLIHVELCLWKIKIDEVRAKEQSALDRESCRINSGASIVLPHLLSFLDELNENDYAVSCPDHRSSTSSSHVDEGSLLSSDSEEE